MKQLQPSETYDPHRYLYSPTGNDLADPVDRLRRVASVGRHPAERMAPSYWKCRCSEGAPVHSLGEVLPGLRLQNLSLRFSISRDEEYVHLELTGCAGTLDMGARAHNYLLLTLARRRVADAASAPSDATSGWVYQDELAHDCTMAAPRLNVDVFRIRKQFAESGVLDAANIIERRPQTRQLRIGTGRLAIVCP
jgi:hypothetical protein